VNTAYKTRNSAEAKLSATDVNYQIEKKIIPVAEQLNITPASLNLMKTIIQFL